MPDESTEKKLHVLIVGGGFAGLGCALRLVKDERVHVTLIDRNNYHQFQPLLYQVATSQLAPSDVADSLRSVFAGKDDIDIKLADIASADPQTRTVVAKDGQEWTADVLVLAAGSEPNFFHTPGAAENSYPLYSLDNATTLRSRILGLLEQVDRDPQLVARGALNFVIVGGGPTGVEVAGAIGDMVQDTMPVVYPDLDAAAAEVHLVDHGDALLKPFSEDAHVYVDKVLREKGVKVHLGVGLTEVCSGHAEFSDGTSIATRCVVWGGGIQGPALARAAGIAQGHGGRLDAQPDLTLADHPDVYVIGDLANIADGDGDGTLPQLGSVAMQSGSWAAENILADLDGKPRKPFAYHDKGIMAMIGRGAAIAEVGKRHHEIHGELAHMSWLGVHAALMTGTKAKIEAFVDWAWDGFSKTGGPHVLDRGDAAQIDWDDDPVAVGASSSAGG